MLLADLVQTSQLVASTRSRLAKRAALSALLIRADAVDIELVVTYLAGQLRQRRTGIGWAALRPRPDAAAAATLMITEVDAELQRISVLSGAGSGGQRTGAVQALLARATEQEQDFLSRLISGAIRQGALDSAMLDAVADASGVGLAQIRRAAMLAGGTAPVAVAALTGGSAAVAQFDFSLGRAVRPMLASSAADVGAALDQIAAPATVDVKLDGIRIQAHKGPGDAVRLFTRSLDDITDRLPEVVAQVRALPADRLVLDGEVLAVGADGRPRPFQETAARTATSGAVLTVLSAFFFDCLAVGDDVLIDRPLRERLDRLDAVVPASGRVRRLSTTDHAAGAAFFSAALADGQEGVVVKDLDSVYEAGRRGQGWIKVKPRFTLDLVVVAVEWGSGRRQGTLSNIHLAARNTDPAGPPWIMLGKTFKGMTDEMLAWQTKRFLELETSRTGHVVHLRPEQVVEIAFDGLQRSSRYAGGLALRFARVLRYRADKTAVEADTIETVRAISAQRH